MNQNIMFLEYDGKQFAMLNLSQFCYIEGVEETEEYPDGSKSCVYFHSGGKTIGIPYRQLADAIAKQIKDGYEFSAKWQEASRQAATEASSKMMREVMREFHGHD